MILIEFLKMVVQNIAYLRVRTSPLAMVPAWVISLGTFKYPMVREVGFRLDRCLRPMLLIPFQPRMSLAYCLICGIFARVHCQALSHAPLRLVLCLCA
jgi:hypothetical protein